MNKNQQKVSLGTAALIALMTLMPPFHQINVKGFANRHYYDFIFAQSYLHTINLTLLITQIFLVLSVGSILYLLFGKRNG